MTPLFLLFQLFSPVDPLPLAAFHEQRIARLEAGTPEARAAHRDLGLFWLRINRFPDAEAQLRQALPDPEVAPFLAEAVAAQGRSHEAEELFGTCRKKARCLSRLAQFAERRGDAHAVIALLQQALAIEPTNARRNDLAQALQSAGDMKEAETLFRTAARDTAANPENATTWNNLASLLLATDRAAEAETWQRKALQVFQRHLGARHVRTGLSASNLADILRARGREAEAIPLYRQALEIFQEQLPAGHPWIREAREALRPQGR
ncbi:MAG: tetratricopeptide repeat protein [Acidobacteria bacterium]|nr:tetratricopeptide repeat protein [Acidobacteriota bacterium]